jgi:hypothetical protein
MKVITLGSLGEIGFAAGFAAYAGQLFGEHALLWPVGSTIDAIA